MFAHILSVVLNWNSIAILGRGLFDCVENLVMGASYVREEFCRLVHYGPRIDVFTTQNDWRDVRRPGVATFCRP